MPPPLCNLFCVSKRNGVEVFCFIFSYVKTENIIRSILVWSLKVPMRRVLLRISRNRRSMAFMVCKAVAGSEIEICKKVTSSGKSDFKAEDHFGVDTFPSLYEALGRLLSQASV